MTPKTELARSTIVNGRTPLEPLTRLSQKLCIDLWIKRDDLAGPTYGGNKSRQLEYYFGAAEAQCADTILITGAVQSNFVRLAASVANAKGLRAVVQLEDRVASQDETYKNSGNVLLNNILGAEIRRYSQGEDESGADRALEDYAAELSAQGGNPYVIHLGEEHPPLGALGYMRAAEEILTQKDDFEFYVVASGSGSTHAGLLAGLKSCGSKALVFGSCVRRVKPAQEARIKRILARLTALDPNAGAAHEKDVIIWDGALAPGYGKLGANATAAIELMAQYEGLILDPVYTAKSLAAVPALIEDGTIPKGSKVCFVHTGGLAALFAYANMLYPQF